MSDKIYYKDSEGNVILIDKVDYQTACRNLMTVKSQLENLSGHNVRLQNQLDGEREKHQTTTLLYNTSIVRREEQEKKIASLEAKLAEALAKNEHNQTWANALLDGVPHVMIRPSNARFKSTRFRGDFVHCVHCGTLSNTIPRICCTPGNADDAFQDVRVRPATKGSEDVQKYTSTASDNTSDC